MSKPKPEPDPTTAAPGPESRDLADRLRKVETSNVTWTNEDFPVFWSKGDGVFVEDVDGHRFLDMTAAFGVTALGHSPIQTRSAINLQSEKLIHGMGDVHPPAIKVELLEKLASRVPVKDPRITLGTGGSMATEIALKACHIATGKPGMLAFEGGYHGLTLGALSVVGHEKFLQPFSEIVSIGLPRLKYPASGLEKGEAPSGNLMAESLQEIQDTIERFRDSVGGIIIEPIQGRGGIRIPPPGFLKALRQLCWDHQILLICDEIFTGFYRTGTQFAVDSEEVFPDIILLGKALGGGMPVGACIGTRDVMDSFGPSMGEAIHTETFLGHPATMAAALGTLEYFDENNMTEKVEKSSKKLQTILREVLGARPEFFGNPRGRGLMWGVDCLKDGKPWPELSGMLMRCALKAGLIVLGGGLQGNVLQFTPALNIKDRELEEMGERLELSVNLALDNLR